MLVTVALAAALAATVSHAADHASDYPKDCGNVPVKTYFHVDSLFVQVEVPQQGLAASPPYDPDDLLDPPVKPGEAVRLAKSELRRAVADEDEWSFANLSLIRACGRRAFYEVTWQRYAKGQNAQITVPVLLSGEVVSTVEAIKDARKRAQRGSGLR